MYYLDLGLNITALQYVYKNPVLDAKIPLLIYASLHFQPQLVPLYSMFLHRLNAEAEEATERGEYFRELNVYIQKEQKFVKF